MTEKIINLVGVSGGKDSDATLLWAVHESGYPLDTIRATFCDTGNESEETYAHIQMLHETVHPIEWLRPVLGFYELAKKKGRFPSARARFCTQHLKMIPTQKYISALQAEGYTVVSHSGVRRGESTERAKLGEWDTPELSAFGCAVRRPLLLWSLQDVWDIHARYGVPRNVLYDMGASRVGCLPCIMSRKAEIRTIAQLKPERIDMIQEQEVNCGRQNRGGFTSFFSPNVVPLRYRSKIIQAPAKKKKEQAGPLGRWQPERDTEAQGWLELMFSDDYAEIAKAPPEAAMRDVAIATVSDVVRWALSDADDSEPLDLVDWENEVSCSAGMCE